MNTIINKRREINYPITNLNNCDKVFLQSILKRQYYVLKDLYKLHDSYPNIIEKDLVGSLDSLFRIMADMSDSICAK